MKLYCKVCNTFVGHGPRRTPGDELCHAHWPLWTTSKECNRYHSELHYGLELVEPFFVAWVERVLQCPA